MEYIFIAILILLFLAIIAVSKRRKIKHRPPRYDTRGFDSNRIHRNGTKYDDSGFDYFGYNADGFDIHGYNVFGKNAKNQYNRFYDRRTHDEEGFLSHQSPVVLTDHARMRMKERLGISDYRKMDAMAVDAYRFGKSKRQIKKTSAFLIDEIEQKYDNSVALIYRNYVYVFTSENVLKTVYLNDRISL